MWTLYTNMTHTPTDITRGKNTQKQQGGKQNTMNREGVVNTMALPSRRNHNNSNSGAQPTPPQQPTTPQGKPTPRATQQPAPRPRPAPRPQPAPRAQQTPRNTPIVNPYDTPEDTHVFSDMNTPQPHPANRRGGQTATPADTNYDEYTGTGFEDMEQPTRPQPRPQPTPRSPRNTNYNDNYYDNDYNNTYDNSDDYDDNYYDDDYDNDYDDDYDNDYNTPQNNYNPNDPIATHYQRKQQREQEFYAGMEEPELTIQKNRQQAYENAELSIEETTQAQQQREAKQKQDKKQGKKPRKGFFHHKNKTRQRDKNNKETYINETDLTLEPFAKRKVKVSEFDKRRNAEKRSKLIQYSIIALTIGLVGLGVKNAIIPPDVMTEQEVAQISLNTIGETGFPEDRGAAFAKDFITSYVTIGANNPQSEALNYFYKGKVGKLDPNEYAQRPNNSNSQANGLLTQNIIVGPTIYERKSIDATSAYYNVGVLIKPDADAGMTEHNTPWGKTGNEGRWVFFNVNVYYDPKTDLMYITPDSPTITPDKHIGVTGDTPDSKPLGNGTKADDSTAKTIAPLIYGYIEAYSESTSQNTNKLQQYLSKDASQTAKDGLGGEYTLAGEQENAIKYETYLTNDPNTLKAKVTVNWANNITKDGTTETVGGWTQKSTYVATLHKAGDGKWEIQNFDSFKYLPDTEKLAQNP